MTKQYEFIEPLKKMIINHCPRVSGVSESAIRTSIERWENGEPARTPWEMGVFEVCNQVKKEVQSA